MAEIRRCLFHFLGQFHLTRLQRPAHLVGGGAMDRPEDEFQLARLRGLLKGEGAAGGERGAKGRDLLPHRRADGKQALPALHIGSKVGNQDAAQ